MKSRIRIRTNVGSRIRIRIKVTSSELWRLTLEFLKLTMGAVEAHNGAVKAHNGAVKANNGALAGPQIRITFLRSQIGYGTHQNEKPDSDQHRNDT